MELDSPMDFQTNMEHSRAFAAELTGLMRKYGVESISIEDRTHSWGLGGEHVVVVNFDHYEIPSIKFTHLQASDALDEGQSGT